MLNSRPFKTFSKALACVALIACARATAQTWTLLPQAQVTSAGVFLDQLVSGGETNAQLHVRLCNAPATGRTLQLSVAQLRPLVTTAAPAWSGINWTGAPSIQVSRRMRLLPAQEILQALADHLRKELVHDESELELRFARPWVATPIADEPYTLHVPDLPLSGLTPNFHLRFELASESETLGTWQTPMEARLWKVVWICQQPLRRGSGVLPTDVAKQRRDVLKLPRDLLPTSIESQEDWQVTENINPGQPVLRRAIQARVVIQKGQMVDAFLKEGSLSISLKAEVLDNGAPGQIVRIRNPNSRREIRAKVINEQTVQLQL